LSLPRTRAGTLRIAAIPGADNLGSFRGRWLENLALDATLSRLMMLTPQECLSTTVDVLINCRLNTLASCPFLIGDHDKVSASR